MADITFSTRNSNDLYYCEQLGSSVTACSSGTTYIVRWNAEGTNSWVRSRAFTTGDYDVSNITIRVTDCNTRLNGYGSPSFGISTSKQQPTGNNVVPSCSWSGSDTTNSTSEGGGYNCYSVTLSVNMKARTTYYLYLYTQATSTSSSVGWQCLSHPSSSSDTRTTTVDLIFNTKTESIPTYALTLSKGTGISSVSGAGSYESGTSVTISATPSTGYNFTKWTNSSGTSVSTSSSYTFSMPAAATTYTANATKKTYTVSYNKGTYGTGTNTSTTKTYGTALTLSGAIFTRSGYTQTGWASDAAGTNFVYATGGSYTTNAAVTLYPYWTREIYTLSINPNGGSMYNGDSKTSSTFTTEFAYDVKTYMGNLNSSASFEPNNSPTKPGYTLSSFTFSGGSGQINTAGDTFYFMGESPEAASSTANTTNTYIFNGNYVGNVTATANYTANTYYVQYDANGGSGTMDNSTHTYGSASYLTANAFTYAGYIFSGWNTAANGSGTVYEDKAVVSTLTTVNKGTVVLYAQWGSGTYSISFDLKGGSSYGADFSTMTCTVGQSYTLPTGDLYKTKYTFAGWDTSSAASTVVYTDAATITDIASAGSSITLYAVWIPKTLTLVYNSNDGQSLTSTQTCDFSNAVSYATLPTSWTREGYSAVGWGLTASKVDYLFGQSITTDMGYEDGDTVNLYCIWTERDPWTLSVINIYIPDQGGWIAF